MKSLLSPHISRGVTLTRDSVTRTIPAESHTDFMRIVERKMPPRLTYVIHPIEDDDRQPAPSFPHGTAFRLEVFTPPQGMTYDNSQGETNKHPLGMTYDNSQGETNKHPLGMTYDNSQGETNKQPLGETNKVSYPLESERMRPKAPKSTSARPIPDQFKYRQEKKRAETTSLFDQESPTFLDEVYGYACQRASDFLNESFHIQGSRLMPSQDELAGQLLKILESLFEITSLYDAQGGKSAWTLTDVEAARMANNAARFVLREWDPYYFTRRAIAGAIGGSRSKRPSGVTPAMLRRVDGLTPAQAAKKLKVSEKTIQRRRAEEREQPAFK